MLDNRVGLCPDAGSAEVSCVSPQPRAWQQTDALCSVCLGASPDAVQHPGAVRLQSCIGGQFTLNLAILSTRGHS